MNIIWLDGGINYWIIVRVMFRLKEKYKNIEGVGLWYIVGIDDIFVELY